MLAILCLVFSAFAESEFEVVDETFQPEVATVLPGDMEYDLSLVTSETWCAICKEVAQFGEDLLNEHALPAIRNLIYTKLCDKKSGTLGQVCKIVTDKIIDLAADLVKKLATPEKICTTIKVC